jgi:hypothetical protein
MDPQRTVKTVNAISNCCQIHKWLSGGRGIRLPFWGSRMQNWWHFSLIKEVVLAGLFMQSTLGNEWI